MDRRPSGSGWPRSYSLLLFGLAALVLGGVYLGVSQRGRRAAQPVQRAEGQAVRRPAGSRRRAVPGRRPGQRGAGGQLQHAARPCATRRCWCWSGCCCSEPLDRLVAVRPGAAPGPPGHRRRRGDRRHRPVPADRPGRPARRAARARRHPRRHARPAGRRVRRAAPADRRRLARAAQPAGHHPDQRWTPCCPATTSTRPSAGTASAVAARATARMSRLVEDLLATARRTAPAFTETDVDLAAVAEDAAEEFALLAGDAAPAWTAGCRPGTVIGDRDALRRALDNLLSNAVALAPGAAPSRSPPAGSAAGPGWRCATPGRASSRTTRRGCSTGSGGAQRPAPAGAATDRAGAGHRPADRGEPRRVRRPAQRPGRAHLRAVAPARPRTRRPSRTPATGSRPAAGAREADPGLMCNDHGDREDRRP